MACPPRLAPKPPMRSGSMPGAKAGVGEQHVDQSP